MHESESSTNKVKVYASLTSIPPRLNDTKKSIDSLLNQSYPIEHIFLNIPYGRHERTKMDYFVPEYLNQPQYANVSVIRCQEYGPATKLLGSIPHVTDPNAFIYVIDDDMVYPKNHLTNLVNQIESNTDAVTNPLCHANRDYKKGVCGNYGFIVRRGVLDGIYNFYESMPKTCYTVDDMWMGLYLHKRTPNIKTAPRGNAFKLYLQNVWQNTIDPVRLKTGLRATVNQGDNNYKCMKDYQSNIDK